MLRKSLRYRLRQASYKHELQVPAAKLVITDPVQLENEVTRVVMT